MLLVSIVFSQLRAPLTLDNQLSHVRDVEHADVLPHGLMFLDDARVLHRHEPAAERNDFCAAPHMFFVKRSAFLRGLAHVRQARLAKE